MNLLTLGGIALIGAACVGLTVQSIQGTPNLIGKVIAGILSIGMIFVVFIFVLDSPLFQYWGIFETLNTFQGIVALVIGGCCGYFLNTNRKL